MMRFSYRFFSRFSKKNSLTTFFHEALELSVPLRIRSATCASEAKWEIMQDTLFSLEPQPVEVKNPARDEDITLIFNTAFVRTRTPSKDRNLAAELAALSQTPAGAAIRGAAQALAKQQGLSELEASEQIITTFRKLDKVWKTFLLQEGMARLNGEES